MIINESKSYKKGDKVKFTLPDTLDAHMEGTIDHKASTKEINDAGWDNCTEKDDFYVINTKYKGKDTTVVSPANGITLKESIDEGVNDDIKTYIKTSIRMLGELSVKVSNAAEQDQVKDKDTSKIRNTINDLQKLLNNLNYT